MVRNRRLRVAASRSMCEPLLMLDMMAHAGWPTNTVQEGHAADIVITRGAPCGRELCWCWPLLCLLSQGMSRLSFGCKPGTHDWSACSRRGSQAVNCFSLALLSGSSTGVGRARVHTGSERHPSCGNMAVCWALFEVAADHGNPSFRRSSCSCAFDCIEEGEGLEGYVDFARLESGRCRWDETSKLDFQSVAADDRWTRSRVDVLWAASLESVQPLRVERLTAIQAGVAKEWPEHLNGRKSSPSIVSFPETRC